MRQRLLTCVTPGPLKLPKTEEDLSFAQVSWVHQLGNSVKDWARPRLSPHGEEDKALE